MFKQLCTLFSLSLSILAAQSLAEQKIQIIASGGTQAEILPADAFSMAPSNRGWARLAGAISSRKEKEQPAIFLDCGGSLHGSPLAYVQNKVRPDLPNPVVEILNGLGCQALVPGGPDFSFGLAALNAAEKRAKFPFIAANVIDSSGKLIFRPYAVADMNGIKVALLGLSLPAAPRPLSFPDSPPFFFRDAIEAAKEWVPRLRDAEKADLIIVVAHTASEGPRKVTEHENTAFWLADNVPGIDGIIAFQSHQAFASSRNGIPIVQPSPFGQSFSAIGFALQRRGARWAVRSAVPLDIPLDPASPFDSRAMQISEALRNETEEYLNTHATQINIDLDGRWSTVEPTPMVELLHIVQKRATGAQLSAAQSPGTHVFIQKGPTSVRQFFALAPHESRVASIRISGAQLRAYLEHSAKYFHFSYMPELLNRNIPLADYDMVGGCEYAIDISRPPGKRVSYLKFAGQLVRDEQTFTMAISTYRLAGGGGYMDAIGFDGRSEKISNATLRNLLLEYVLSRPMLSIPAGSNWRTIPWLERERVVSAYGGK